MGTLQRDLSQAASVTLLHHLGGNNFQLFLCKRYRENHPVDLSTFLSHLNYSRILSKVTLILYLFNVQTYIVKSFLIVNFNQ